MHDSHSHTLVSVYVIVLIYANDIAFRMLIEHVVCVCALYLYLCVCSSIMLSQDPERTYYGFKHVCHANEQK